VVVEVVRSCCLGLGLTWDSDSSLGLTWDSDSGLVLIQDGERGESRSMRFDMRVESRSMF